MIQIKSKSIPYQDPFKLYKKLSNNGNNISLLMESRSRNLHYGKKSIVVPNPAVRVIGKNQSFILQALTPAGKAIIKTFSKKDFAYANTFKQTKTEITGTVIQEKIADADEEARRRQKNISFVIRTILNKFKCKSSFAGLHGMIAYDFAKNFYESGDDFAEEEGNDFVLFIPTTLYVFDDIKEKAEKLQVYFNKITDKETKGVKGFTFNNTKDKETIVDNDMTKEEYTSNVKKILKDIKNGRCMQCVYSRKVEISLTQHPLNTYETLRKTNPSPYSYFFNLGDNEILYGASPEEHIVIENGTVEIRPIAGTIRRSKNPLEDAKARIQLLTDKKELREHTMLVDLARHELYYLSEPDSVEVTDLFTLEHYPNLYHLVSGVRGKLKKGVDAVDALLVTLPAGTLTGAPKQEAMKMIDEYEHSRRGFYGGTVGYLAFNGDANTGITIRSVMVKKDKSILRAGGGVVALSTPEREYNESTLKMEKMRELVEGK
jgi:anthranilate/para-aminobenzoate synthase component I